MKLSVIIVNYNVKYFLEQCLHSVFKALKNLESEVFVVDNNSVDGSCGMVKDRFPQVKLISNKDNRGFSYANNQAIAIARGEYILLLNPDTLVEENTFTKIIDFMDEQPQAGGLGVKMIDGNGTFLPESKRALPTPSVAFYKVFGLSRLFPHSKRFNHYHLVELNRDEIHEIEVLSGAFMFLRKKVLDEIGMLDEAFFMYGEDIDLSYRIIKAGYKNYYFPHTTIIHYKGESTKKGSINYVLVFYNAMMIFAQKHFSQKNAKLFSFIIEMAVYFRAGLSIIKRILKAAFLPVFDALLIFLGFYLAKPYWEHYKFPEGGSYPAELLLIAVPAYISIWVLAIYFIGGYSKPIKISKIYKGLAIGTAVILIIYALLSENYRFSRALILIGTAWSYIMLSINRFLLHYLKISNFRLDLNQRKRFIIVGNPPEVERVSAIVQQNVVNPDIVGAVQPTNTNGEELNNDQTNIGTIEQLREIITINRADEVIFCAKDISSQEIIKNMLDLSDIDVSYKIAPPESLSIIGSNSINTAGDLYIINTSSIAKDFNRRNKRLFDIVAAVLMLTLLPILLPIVMNRWGFIKNIFHVLAGKLSWVGYFTASNISTDHLPRIKSGVLNPLDSKPKTAIPKKSIERLNILYAKDYKLLNDIFLIFKAIRHIGRQPSNNL